MCYPAKWPALLHHLLISCSRMHAEGYMEDVAAIFNTHPVSFFFFLRAKTADDSEELLYET